MLDWTRAADPPHQQWLSFHRSLLQIREKDIIPLLAGETVPRARWTALGERALRADWTFPGERVLRLVANLGAESVRHGDSVSGWGRCLYGPGLTTAGAEELPPWSVAWYLQEVER